MMREVWWWWIRQVTRRRVGTRAVHKLAQRRLTQVLHAFFAVVTREVEVREREREAFEAQQLRLQIHLQRLQLTSVAESMTATATAVDMSPLGRVPAEAADRFFLVTGPNAFAGRRLGCRRLRRGALRSRFGWAVDLVVALIGALRTL